MARREALGLALSLPGCFQFTQIHRDHGCPFRSLPHQLTCTKLSRDTPRPSPTGVGIWSSKESSGRCSEGQRTWEELQETKNVRQLRATPYPATSLNR
jgi:hypothetical protein